MLLPSLTGLEPEDALAFAVEAGEIYVRTTRASLRIQTPDGHVDLAAADLARSVIGVAVEDAETCFCVAEGEVRVHPLGEESGEGRLVGSRQSFLVADAEPHGPMPFPEEAASIEHLGGLLAFAAR